MKTRLLFLPGIFLTLMLTLPMVTAGQPAEISRQISAALATGNAAGTASYFNDMVDLSLPGTEDNFGKTQAQRILMDFFAKNPVKSYKITKQGNSNDGSQFTIGKMEAGGKIYRVYYLLKKNGEKYLIHQFQIQKED